MRTPQEESIIDPESVSVIEHPVKCFGLLLVAHLQVEFRDMIMAKGKITGVTASLSPVAIVEGVALGYSKQHARMVELLDALDRPLTTLIRPGDKVFVKPYLRNGSNDSPESLQVSQPGVIRALLEIIKDCGASVAFGDEGSPNPWSDQPHPGRFWLYELARRTGCELVNFAASGGVFKEGTCAPYRYLISRALTDADAVINLAHFQFHPKFVINGCIKNTFNAVLGKQQEHLERLFRSTKRISKRVVDVHAIVRPSLSILI